MKYEEILYEDVGVLVDLPLGFNHNNDTSTTAWGHHSHEAYQIYPPIVNPIHEIQTATDTWPSTGALAVSVFNSRRHGKRLSYE